MGAVFKLFPPKSGDFQVRDKSKVEKLMKPLKENWMHPVPNMDEHEAQYRKYGDVLLRLIHLRDQLLRKKIKSFSYREVHEWSKNKDRPKGVDKNTIKTLAENILGFSILGKNEHCRKISDCHGWYKDWWDDEYLTFEPFKNNFREKEKESPKNGAYLNSLERPDFTTDSPQIHHQDLKNSPQIHQGKSQEDGAVNRKTTCHPKPNSPQIHHQDLKNSPPGPEKFTTEQKIPITKINRKHKHNSPCSPPPGVMEKALEFSKVYPQSGWIGTPKKWTQGLLDRVAHRMMDDRFTGFGSWTRFMAATREYASQCKDAEPGKILCPVNFIGKDWARDHYRPQPDRPWNTWLEFLPIGAHKVTADEVWQILKSNFIACGISEAGGEALGYGEAEWADGEVLKIKFHRARGMEADALVRALKDQRFAEALPKTQSQFADDDGRTILNRVEVEVGK